MWQNTDKAIEITTDPSGIRTADVDMKIQNDQGNISGQTLEEEETEKGNGRKYHRMERQMGRFSGSVRLHCDMQQVKVDAELKDGALTVRMPQVEDVKSKKLPLRG